MKTGWMNTLAWPLAALAAVVLAVAAPNESAVMGKMPAVMAKRLDQQPVALPEGLPSNRTLAFISFNRTHQRDIESWIDGLRLRQDPSINWLRIPVLDDPGHAQGRTAIEHRLLARYPSDGERARMVPVFTDRAAFSRATGLTGTDRAYAVVMNRHGDVLARVAGQFDEDKAGALRETLLGGDD